MDAYITTGSCSIIAGCIRQVQSRNYKSRFEPSELLCSDKTVKPAGSWQPWTCLRDRFDEECLRVETPQAESFQMNTCKHLNRFVFKPVGCLDNACSTRVVSEEVFICVLVCRPF